MAVQLVNRLLQTCLL